MTHQPIRVVVISDTEHRALMRLVSPIDVEVNEEKDCGILYERPPSQTSLRRRMVDFGRNLTDVGFLLYAAHRIARVLAGTLSRLRRIADLLASCVSGPVRARPSSAHASCRPSVRRMSAPCISHRTCTQTSHRTCTQSRRSSSSARRGQTWDWFTDPES